MGTHDGSRPTGPTERADVLARLAEQMNEITAPGAGDEVSRGVRHSARSSAAISSVTAVGSGGLDAAGKAASGHGPASRRSATGGRRATAGGRANEDGYPPGHPEDDPGDPESVARAICLRLLASAARPRAGLAAALKRKGIPDDVAARVLDRLTEVGLIDDAAYAQSFVDTRHRHGALGAGALREELKRKGVDTQTAASAVAVVDREAEYERARALLERRVDSAMAHGPEAGRRRLLGLLARRGYPADLAQRVVEEVITAYGAEVDSNWS